MEKINSDNLQNVSGGTWRLQFDANGTEWLVCGDNVKFRWNEFNDIDFNTNLATYQGALEMDLSEDDAFKQFLFGFEKSSQKNYAIPVEKITAIGIDRATIGNYIKRQNC